MSLQERIDDSFFGHSVIPNDEFHRAGVPILTAIAEATPESLAKPKVLGAWIRRSSEELVVVFLAEHFAIDQVTIMLGDGLTQSIDIPDENIAYNRAVGTHAIDYRVVVPVPGLSRAVTSVALVRDGAAQTPYFPLTELTVREDAEQRDAPESSS